MASTTSASNPPPCPFLEKLPAEIRNEIYELAFTQDSSTSEIELFEAKSPSKALLSTCRQDTYGKYWHANRFVCTLSTWATQTARRICKDSLDPLHDFDLENISSLCIKCTDGDKIVLQHTLRNPRGGWSISMMETEAYVVLRKGRQDGCYVTYVWSLDLMRRCLDVVGRKVTRKMQIRRFISQGGIEDSGEVSE
ncbi:hypothetical protein M409DRAFT_22800 [Zasmidium cellare ATCC 36951]|uniref:Uncharacterized protein n=1 Tax=Zasmidium cellare ATCC 36951 TaxID=1080233 RepID=A0A6A6CMS1_ZASCE|nr:uncharacterized protein M409DRAFT_22800 [Zasmidium cellare ATCC 36951]KAF2166746.1 hypothetical protein M409DRAFT_22800 [Zasmidium cellare ATCC 36951]